jgi:hypothetical protein
VSVLPKVEKVGVVAPTAFVKKTDTMLRMKSAVMNSAAGFAIFLRFIELSVFSMLFVFIFFSLPKF